MRYVIMECCPFPGYFEPLALCWLQDAEINLAMARRFYHERAQFVGSLLTYSESDARRIVDYRRQHAPYAEHFLFGIPE